VMVEVGKGEVEVFFFCEALDCCLKGEVEGFFFCEALDCCLMDISLKTKRIDFKYDKRVSLGEVYKKSQIVET